MEIQEVKTLLQRYFNGESTSREERILEDYFVSGKVAEELKEYTPFFKGISDLAGSHPNSGIEGDIMDFILENEHSEKNRYRGLWKTVTGIAASVILILGGFLIYEQQQKPFEDTYSNPDVAYLQAEKTLQYISGKYNAGLAKLPKTAKYNKALAELNRFGKIGQASKPLSESVKTINKGFNEIENLEKYNQLTKNE